MYIIGGYWASSEPGLRLRRKTTEPFTVSADRVAYVHVFILSE